MLLSELLIGIDVREQIGADVAVTRISTRSGENNTGAVFVCLVGGAADAHDCAAEAIERGAAAIVAERRLKADCPQIVVSDTRAALARMAATFFGDPGSKMLTAAIVGTNGKTTTAHMLRAILEYAGIPTCLIGTNGFTYGDTHSDFGMTTPDPVEWQSMLDTAQKAGCRAAITEVSAHAIRYKKTLGTVMDVAVFTNFSQDHLDFFGDMKTYGETKASFFTTEFTRSAVINTDDALGLEIALKRAVPMITYGLTSPSDVFAIDYRDTAAGARFLVNLRDELYEVRLPMHGEYNMYNALAAMTAAELFGIQLESMANALRKLPQIEGRYQTFDFDGIKIVVDFAHTPDGITKLLDSVAEWAEGKVITVFGCGGNRDREKRPVMAAAAELRANTLVMTSDNPRFENPTAILEDMRAGLREPSNAVAIPDRSAAIQYAIRLARPGDVVTILGKGSEPYMEIAGEKRPYSDLNVVKSLFVGDRQ